ncbi:MAG: rhomboid family intramembrane serine protease [Bacillota bacterium]
MKQRYLNAVFTNLILKQDFEPYRTPDDQNSMILQSYGHGVYCLVELLDGDLLSPGAITARLQAGNNFLLESDGGEILQLIEVLVFNNSPSEDKLLAASGVLGQNLPGKHLTVCVVDLVGETVTRLSRSSGDSTGVEKVLKTFLREPTDAYEVLPDLNRLLSLREREYTIKLKASKSSWTYTLIVINILAWLAIYLYAFLDSKSYDYLIINFGAKVNSLIMAGQYWRLISPVFLHAANPLHLAVNCYSLYVVGNIVERIYGHSKFLILYFMAGLFGSIASFIFSPYPAIGASGAIFGLLGALAYYGVEKPKTFKKYFGYNVLITIVINVLIGLSIPGIDNFAHMGGLAGGFLTGYAVKVEDRPGMFVKQLLLFIALVAIAAAGFYFGRHLPRNLALPH